MDLLTVTLYAILGVGSVFLIILVLIQRGRGGGLAGALGGMGGYSAFGTRAGDVFTRITIGAAAVWILAAILLAHLNLKNAGKYKGPEAADRPAAGVTGSPVSQPNSPGAQTSGEQTTGAPKSP